MPVLNVKDVKRKYEAKIMKIDGVVGIGIGMENNQDAIVVFVKERTARIDKKVPKQLKGFPVVIRESGRISAF